MMNKNPTRNNEFLLPLLSASEKTIFSQMISPGSAESSTISYLISLLIVDSL
jgi:hypothetical protein